MCGGTMETRLRFQNRPDQTGKDRKRDDNTAPVETARCFLRIAARQQNRENDQHRDRADINEHQDQSDEFCAEQEEEGCEPEQRQTKQAQRASGCNVAPQCGEREIGMTNATLFIRADSRGQA